jgi:hypothetical protein
LKNNILKTFKAGTDVIDLFDTILFYIFYGLIIFNLVLTTFSERFFGKYEGKINGLKKSPENVTPLLSKLSFLWIDP